MLTALAIDRMIGFPVLKHLFIDIKQRILLAIILIRHIKVMVKILLHVVWLHLSMRRQHMVCSRPVIIIVVI